jgi:hypothetical protein
MVSEEFDEEIGVPIPEDGVDIDGVLRAMEGFVEEEEEIDGIPMDENLSIAESDVNQEQDTRFTTGSWSTVSIHLEDLICNFKKSRLNQKRRLSIPRLQSNQNGSLNGTIIREVWLHHFQLNSNSRRRKKDRSGKSIN